jgi:HSP20 family protein
MQNELRHIPEITSASKANTFFGRTVEDYIEPGFNHNLYSNIWHDEKEYTLEVPVPGLSKEDITITVEENVLWISGARKTKHVYHDVVEFNSSHFRRSFVLPPDCTPEGIRATCKHGLLTLNISRSKPANNGRAIPVQGSSPLKDESWWTRLQNWARRTLADRADKRRL